MDTGKIQKYLKELSDKVLQRAITDGDVTAGLLSIEQVPEFIRGLEEKSVVLDEARMIKMNSYQREIPVISMPGGILYPGRTSSGKVVIGGAGSIAQEATPDFEQNVLGAKEVVAYFSIDYDTLEDTIEGKNFEQTVSELFGRAVSRDLEKALLFGDTEDISGPDTQLEYLLSSFDGWFKKAAAQLPSESDPEFNYDDDGVVGVFDAMMNAIPSPFLANRRELRFYVDWELYQEWTDVVMTRYTGVGDAALTEGQVPPFKGIPVVHVPAFDDDDIKTLNSADHFVLLSMPSNMVWGVFRDIMIETQRNIYARTVDHVLSMRCDAHYEQTAGAVAATIASS